MTDDETPYIYCGKPLYAYSLWDLGVIEKSLLDAEARREEASKHIKFNKDTKEGAKTIPRQDFPPPNPEFVKLKSAIEAEIRNRQNVS